MDEDNRSQSPDQHAAMSADARPAATDGGAYEHAIAACADAILRMHFGERLINKVFGRTLQSHAAGLILVMHCEALHGFGPRPTLAALRREMGHGRTLVAFVGLLRLAGYLGREPVAQDARTAHLVPAPQLFDGLGRWLAHHARCCETLGLLAPGEAARLRSDPAWLRQVLAHARILLSRTRARMAGDCAWAWFDAFDCGDRVALVLLRAHYAAPGDGSGPRWFALGAREIAGKLGVSHSHIRNIVNAAEAEGLLRQDRAGGRVALAPRFLAESEAWFRDFWGWLAQTVAEAARHASRAA